jgi:ABC-type Na+ efflux pump permease subunit
MPESTPGPAQEKMPTLSPEQMAFLVQFSANYVAGRRLMCSIAHIIVALGALAGVITAALALADKLHGGIPVPH